MAVTVWADSHVRFADIAALRNGIEVSVATLRNEEGNYDIRFKTCEDEEWDADEDAIEVASGTQVKGVIAIAEENDGALVVLSGTTVLYRSRDGGSHWDEV